VGLQNEQGPRGARPCPTLSKCALRKSADADAQAARERELRADRRIQEVGLVAVAAGLAITPAGLTEFGSARRPPSPLQMAAGSLSSGRRPRSCTADPGWVAPWRRRG